MHCFSCDRERLVGAGERIGFQEVCEGCRADLHACRNCRHHEPSAYNACREPGAERVADPERGNRCEYFAPGGQRGGGAGARREAALSDLEALFERSD